MEPLTAIKALINGPRNFLGDVAVAKPTWTKLRYSNKPHSPREFQNAQTLSLQSEKEKTDNSSGDIINDSANISTSIVDGNATNRPSDLILRSNAEEHSCATEMYDTHCCHYVEIPNTKAALSPVVSDLSTSSVNERQRKLSETVVDWVFDESDSCQMSDISEGASSTNDDGWYQNST